jgi:hypothetical protein
MRLALVSRLLEIMIPELKGSLPSDQSRYVVSDYTFDREGSHQERLIFIVWIH